MSVSSLAFCARAIASATTVRTMRHPLREEPSLTIRSRITCTLHRLPAKLGIYLTGFQIGIVLANTPKASMRINQPLRKMSKFRKLQILLLTLSSPNWKSCNKMYLMNCNSSYRMPHNKLCRPMLLRISSIGINLH